MENKNDPMQTERAGARRRGKLFDDASNSTVRKKKAKECQPPSSDLRSMNLGTAEVDN